MFMEIKRGNHSILGITAGVLANASLVPVAHAGMTVYSLRDIYRLRFEEMSFFLVNRSLQQQPRMKAERFSCLVLVDSSRRIVGGILFHRVRSRPSARPEVLFWNGSEQEWLPMSVLPDRLRKHEGQWVAL